MPAYSETRHLPYTPQQMYALVLDIEHYPAFLPWCRAARIIAREETSFIGELVISFSHLTERYTSRVTPVPPVGDAPGSINVDLVSGPFHRLSNHWRFVPKDGGTEIHLELDFQFKSKLLDSLIGGLFGRASEKMGAAFTARAHALYGPGAL
ncbi:MAG: type II toxin-antitoxin system RatA family toxin [Pseudomonadota bacterium]